MTCLTCKREIGWETIQGMRLYREIDGVKVYRTRCGCGDVERDGKGRVLAPTPPDRR
jgi:hypothetical protein